MHIGIVSYELLYCSLLHSLCSLYSVLENFTSDSFQFLRTDGPEKIDR